MRATLTVYPSFGLNRRTELDFCDLLQIRSALRHHAKSYRKVDMNEASKMVTTVLKKVSAVMAKSKSPTKKRKS